VAALRVHLEPAAHDLADPEDVLVRHAIPGIEPVLAAGDEPGGQQEPQVFGDVRLAEPGRLDQLGDRELAAAQLVEDPEACGRRASPPVMAPA